MRTPGQQPGLWQLLSVTSHKWKPRKSEAGWAGSGWPTVFLFESPEEEKPDRLEPGPIVGEGREHCILRELTLVQAGGGRERVSFPPALTFHSLGRTGLPHPSWRLSVYLIRLKLLTPKGGAWRVSWCGGKGWRALGSFTLQNLETLNDRVLLFSWKHFVCKNSTKTHSFSNRTQWGTRCTNQDFEGHVVFDGDMRGLRCLQEALRIKITLGANKTPSGKQPSTLPTWLTAVFPGKER